MILNLSNIKPDHEDIRDQLETYLNTLDSWKGVVESQTGQGIINMIAAIGAYSQASIRRRYQDSFPETVVSDEASYAIAEMQGVRLNRKLPASASALISCPVDLTLPSYTIFQGAGSFFFNRDAIFLNAGIAQPVILYEGKVIRLTMPGIDQDYALFASKESQFVVSDVDVSLLLDDTPMIRETGGAWTLRGITGFVDSTLPDGKLLIQFGTPDFGGRPRSTQTLSLTYVVTTGAAGNNLDTNSKSVVVTDFPIVTGSFTSTPTGGADERPALTYKNLSAPTFGVFDSAITRQQYITTALSYPGVIDVITFAQREVNPAALEWMNLVKAVLLTSSPWGPSQKQDFLNWFQSKSAYLPKIFLEDPLPVVINISLEIFCFNWVNSTQARLNAEAAVTALFSPRAGILNYDLHLTDITDAILRSDPGIEYVTLLNPTEDIIISAGSLPPPTLVELTTGGSLIETSVYAYGLAVTTPAGVITVKNLSSIQPTGPTSRVELSWNPYPGAVSYQLYRKENSGTLQLVYSGSTPAFIDVGDAPAGGSPPPQTTTPVRYIQIGNLSIVDRYSTRNLRI
jgi:hypothetical protein